MRSAQILAHLSLFYASTNAFVLGVPPIDEWIADSSSSKRQLKDQDALVSAGKKVDGPGFHDGPQIIDDWVEENEADRVAREVQRLTRKYVRFQSAAVKDKVLRDKVSRDNVLKDKRQSLYRIITAADTSISNSSPVAQDGSDFSYFAQIKFGNREKPMWMLIDTGAGTTWVMGSSCQSSACQKHSSYGPGDSDSYQDLGQDFAVAYGSGSVKGQKITDSIHFAGMSFDFQFGVANETSDDFNHFPFDGILGLSMAGGETENFIQSVKNNNQLGQNLFCVYLNRAADGPNTSEISFGACNPDKYTGEFSYTPVGSSDGDWAIPVDAIAYDGQTSGAPKKLAYIDTGTSYIFGPKTDVAAFHAHIPGSTTDDGSSFKVPCDSDKDVSYYFSGVQHNLVARDWIGRPDSTGLCSSNIYGFEVVPGAWLLGDVFLKSVYAVFDKDQKRIGFAARNDPPPVATTASNPEATPPVQNNPGITTSVLPQTTAAPSFGLGGHETSAGAAEASPTSQSGAASYASFSRVNVAAAASLCLFALLGFY